jgi:uncharacterized protein YuzE
MTTPTQPRVSLTIDDEAEAAYLRLGPGPVARTVEFNDAICVDLDALDVVVGVEVLDLGTKVPLDELVAKYHINSAALALLKASIRPGHPSSVAAASNTTHRATSLSASPS